LICKQIPSDAHHLKFAQPRALGRKVSDEFTVPLCRLHHQALHRHGNEPAWWANLQISPLPVASELWASSPVQGIANARAPDRERPTVFERRLGCDEWPFEMAKSNSSAGSEKPSEIRRRILNRVPSAYTLVMAGVRFYAHNIGVVGGLLTVAGMYGAARWYERRQRK
jgi:hypothetical protein